MAPKKGKKGKKKSKEQLEEERRLKEEEEKRLKEEEEKRLAEEKRIREEEERKRQELLAKLRKEELESLLEEANVIDQHVQERKLMLKTILSRREHDDEWSRFVATVRTPDPKLEKDLNTHLSDWAERDCKDITKCLEDCQNNELVCASAERMLALAISQKDTKFINVYKNFLQKSRKLEMEKIDQATYEQLLDSRCIKIENDELVFSILKDKIQYFLWANMCPKSYRMRNVNYDNRAQLSNDFSRPLTTQPCAVRMVHFPWNHFEEKVPEHLVVGGVITMELLSLPPAPKNIRSWTMIMVENDDELTRLPFPIGPHGEAVPVTGTTQSVRIRLTVPSHIYLHDNPTIMRWEESESKWTEDGIHDVTFDKVSRIVNFLTVRMHPIALVVPRTQYMPLNSWSVTPTDDSCIIRLKSDLLSIAVRVTVEGASLIEPDLPEFNHLLNKVMEVPLFFKALSECGICLTPTDEDIERLGRKIKQPTLEKLAYKQLARLSNSVAFGFHEKNTSQDDDTILVRLLEAVFTNKNENNDPIELDEEWYSICMKSDEEAAFKAKSYLVDPSSKSCEMVEGGKAHSHIFRCIKDNCMPETVEVVDVRSDKALCLEHNTRRVLRLLRPLCVEK